jgi:hypothetical protein|tara:strand:- start:1333 stop:1548 length:216 start_codon:yes stop_codon:yes gene_type:complete
MLKANKPPRRIDSLEFRIEQVEMALMNLMIVVANQKRELPEFKKSMDKAENMAKEDSDILSILMNQEGGDA